MEPHKKKSKGGYTDNPGPEDEESGREETGKRGAARKEAAKRMRSSDGAPTITVSIFTGESQRKKRGFDPTPEAKGRAARGRGEAELSTKQSLSLDTAEAEEALPPKHRGAAHVKAEVDPDTGEQKGKTPATSAAAGKHKKTFYRDPEGETEQERNYPFEPQLGRASGMAKKGAASLEKNNQEAWQADRPSREMYKSDSDYQEDLKSWREENPKGKSGAYRGWISNVEKRGGRVRGGPTFGKKKKD
jgi:hypothetical protein